MKHPVHVLYLLQRNEEKPPASLNAAASVFATHPEHLPPKIGSENKPQAIALRTPLDEDVIRGLSQLSQLNLPVLAFGDEIVEGVDALVSQNISAEDLKSMLALLCQAVRNECEDQHECQLSAERERVYRVTEYSIALIEHLMNLRIPSYRERAARVFRACLWIGNHLSLTSGELRELSYASRLREVGKLGLPDRILFTPRILRSLEEQAIYDRYPELGAMALSEFPALHGAARIVEHQLDNFDGSSQSGLMAHKIPLGSRILRVTGAYEMILEENARVTPEDALEIIDKGQGSLFDPLLVKLYHNYHTLLGPGEQKQDTVRMRFADLLEGMVLAEDVWSRNGMKIVSRGTRLTAHVLKILYAMPPDPTQETVEVMR